MIKGKKLKKGDTIGVINMSSVLDSINRTDNMINKLKELGFKVKVGKSCYARYGYLAGTDNVRAVDVNEMFKDKNVDAIICLKGGYGSMRILDLIDYEMIKDNPKIFLGYSDVTAVLIALNQLSNLVTFHGPMLIGEFERGFKEETSKYLKAVLSGQNEIDYINPNTEKIQCLMEGEVSAPIVGGNLSLLVSTIGTKYEINVKNKILFIEEVNEAPYKVDRMLTQLKLAGKFNDCCGIIFGNFNNCTEENSGFEVIDIINDIVLPFKKPTIFNLQSGHCSPNLIIPFGVEAYLNAKEKKLIINSSSTE